MNSNPRRKRKDKKDGHSTSVSRYYAINVCKLQFRVGNKVQQTNQNVAQYVTKNFELFLKF